MTPYYRGPRATLYVSDCRDVFPQLPRQSADLIVADPPYAVNWRGKKRTATDMFEVMAGDDGSVDWPTVIADITRHLLRNCRHLYVFGYTIDELKVLPVGTMAELIWDKQQPGLGRNGHPWGPQHEPIVWGAYDDNLKRRAAGSGRLAARLRQGSVLRVPRKNSGQVTRHPTEKPVPLMRQLIESSSCLGDMVFDPTAGVCSSGVAAVLAGRRWIGVEKELSYADLGVDRLREAERLAELGEAA